MLKRGSFTIAAVAALILSFGAPFTASADTRYSGGYGDFNVTTLSSDISKDLHKVHKRKGDHKHRKYKRYKKRRNRSGIRFYYGPTYDPFYDPFYGPYWGYPRHHYYRRYPRSGITLYFGN